MPAIASLPTFQGANSATFNHPPLDGSLTIPELFAHHAHHSPDHPLFVYADESREVRKICYPEAYRAIRGAAKLVSTHYKRIESEYIQQQMTRSEDDPPTYGILAVADTISYFTLMIGIMYLGFTPFPISTRNSAAGIAHLVQKTGVFQLFVTPDPAMQRLAQQASELLVKDGVRVEIIPIPQFTELYGEGNEDGGVELKKMRAETTVLMLHSSGSTAFPKPIKMINRNFLQWGILPYYGEVDICNRPIAAHSLPMFHAMGAINIVWTTCSGSIMACFKPTSPPVLPTPDVFLQALVATRSELVYCVPAFVEAWARSPENIPILRTLKAIIFAGAPMNEAVGDRLSSAGVTLIPFYGSTEVGCFSMFISNPPKVDQWQYFKVSGHLQVEMIPQEGSEDVFEPVVLASTTFSPNVINIIIGGKAGYATNDLLQRHHSNPNLYKVYGRADDQLMLSTGEKTNPGPLETLFLQDQHIVAAIIFGRGRFQNGVLIQPKEVFDPSDEKELAQFRNNIWPTVEKVNEYAPSHSRIFKEMIITTSPSKPLEYTPKGTPRRQVCIDAYAEEIDALYLAVKESSQTELSPPEKWSPESTLKFVRTAVQVVMLVPVTDDDDLFQQGCDSLQATWIRNTILHALRTSTSIPTHEIFYSFVYSHPSIRALNAFVCSLFTRGNASGRETKESQVATKVQEMQALFLKYAADLRPVSHGTNKEYKSSSGSETVLLTGSTGRFGCHLLAQLVRKPTVVRVFALNRNLGGSEVALKERQYDAFQHWGLDVALLSSEKVVLVASDLSTPRLGLSEERYHELHGSVTTIIHNGWRVDFNLGLSSFEPLIAGVRTLIDFSLRSPLPGGPRFIFVSSISVLRSHPLSKPALEMAIEDASIAVGSGYSESKWVAEQLFARAAQEFGLRTSVIRVGQLSGDTNIGGWNPKEWVPALVGAGKYMGCLPTRNETVTWLPVDIAASALLDMTSSEERFLHLVSPSPTDWNTIFTPIADSLNVPLVPYPEWVGLLQSQVSASATSTQRDAQRGEHGAALSLLDFFQGGNFGEDVPISTDKAVKCSPTLARVRPLGKDDAMRSLRFWENIGHLRS